MKPSIKNVLVAAARVALLLVLAGVMVCFGIFFGNLATDPFDQDAMAGQSHEKHVQQTKPAQLPASAAQAEMAPVVPNQQANQQVLAELARIDTTLQQLLELERAKSSEISH